MFENLKALLHSNETLLKSWKTQNKSEAPYSITKEFNLSDDMNYNDICINLLALEHVPEIMISIEKKVMDDSSHAIVVSITISATTASKFTCKCEKLALAIEDVIC